MCNQQLHQLPAPHGVNCRNNDLVERQGLGDALHAAAVHPGAPAAGGLVKLVVIQGSLLDIIQKVEFESFRLSMG